jgi:tryptophan-rich sensory protein
MVDIVLLSVLIILTIIKAWPVSRLASLLLIPYLIWVGYAATLNIGIWFLND